MGKRLLNSEGNAVQLLSDIKIDETLPKYQIINQHKPEKQIGSNTHYVINNMTFGTPVSNDSSRNNEVMSYENLKKFFIEQNDATITDFNLTVTDTMNKNTKTNNEVYHFLRLEGDSGEKKVVKWYHKLFKKYKEKNEEKRIKKFDVVGFFANVKNFTEEEGDKYKNRIAEYVNCIGYTEMTGQVALKEKLFANLVINKYESVLYANGMYKAISESALVEFAKNCPKELSLDYVVNYTRNIPIEIIKKKVEADKMEIFDNYCILHYDGDKDDSSTEMTQEEKEEEVRKKKDPILFGLIAGSKKLYYVADWVDEYCDLTLDDIVDIVGKETVEKGYIKDKID